MSKEELLQVLKDCAASYDQEGAHIEADEALIRYINDPEITEAFNAIDKWYA